MANQNLPAKISPLKIILSAFTAREIHPKAKPFRSEKDFLVACKNYNDGQRAFMSALWEPLGDVTQKLLLETAGYTPDIHPDGQRVLAMHNALESLKCLLDMQVQIDHAVFKAIGIAKALVERKDRTL